MAKGNAPLSRGALTKAVQSEVEDQDDQGEGYDAQTGEQKLHGERQSGKALTGGV